MQYDALLKELFLSPGTVLIPAISGRRPVAELTAEYATTQRRFPDLVVELEDGTILHVELQSTNDPEMPWRMLEYRGLIQGRYRGRRVEQVVIYFGSAKLNTPSELRDTALTFAYGVMDVRDLDPEALVASPIPSDRVLALLCRDVDARGTVRRIVASWSTCTPKERDDLIAKLLVASGLRNIGKLVEEELTVIREEAYLENTYLLDIHNRAQKATLRRLLLKRFASIPDWAEKAIDKADTAQLEQYLDRILDARTIEEIF